ncbi:MAG: FAD-dependent monooxygenase [Terriglobus roseus]|nr:FAD-dependent monooxygenase [Terriglobus roseus]
MKSITILEQLGADQQEDQGAGIRVADEVVDAVLKYAGIPPEEYCLRGTGMKQLTHTGAVAIEVKQTAWTTVWRQFFAALLKKYQSLESCHYRRDCGVRDLVDNGSTVKVVYASRAGKEESIEADLVVGADGISSTVRKILVPEVRRVSAGYSIIRGLVQTADLNSEMLDYANTMGVFCTTRGT